MQPRFAALLFVLGLADLAYVNLGLGHEVFGGGPSEAKSAGRPTPVPTPAPAAPEVSAPAELPADATPSLGPAPETFAPPVRPGAAARGVEPDAPVTSAASLPAATFTVPFADTAGAGLSAEARAELLELATQLRANPDYRIHIVGHADARGSREFNRDLGGRRARAVTEWLLRSGVARAQLALETRGEDEPKALGNSEQVWATNRRVEISIGIERNTTP